MLNTPVAFLIFNRPDLTSIVFDAIAQAKPKKLLVVADGPRFPEEVVKCRQARAVIERVDWDCEVLTNLSEINLGCKQRVSSGLDWVFSEVEEAIILEDDCLPSPSFFSFCQTLLEYYRYDERIMHISGNNFQFGQSRTEYSYYFSRYSHIWGWASWRRAWKYYDVHIKTWLEYKGLDMISYICDNPSEQQYWIDIFDRVFNGAIDTWDYQWLYACWCQSGLSILPDSNLVSNLGFGIDGTHTHINTHWGRLPRIDIWEIKHPPFRVRHRQADNYTFNTILCPKNLKKNKFLRKKIILSKFKHHQFIGKLNIQQYHSIMNIKILLGRVYKKWIHWRKELYYTRQINHYISNGRKPWTEGYSLFKDTFINQSLNDSHLIEQFKCGLPLPQSYGEFLDDRVVEYPWFISRINQEQGRLLDAGSALNFSYILQHPNLIKKEITIVTLEPEASCYWHKRIAYLFDDIRNLPFKDNFFDDVVSISTIEHLGMDNSIYSSNPDFVEKNKFDFLKAVAELKRVTKPGGKVYITVPYGKYTDFGWYQQFDDEMINVLIETFAPDKFIETYYCYESGGWTVSNKQYCQRFEGFNIHDTKYFNSASTKDYDPDYAAASRAVAALELWK